MSGELPSSIVLIGAGKMGRAMLQGWLKLGVEPSRITAVDPHLDGPGRAALVAARVQHVEAAAGVAPPEALVLAIKPQTLDTAAASMCPLIGTGTLVLSILAGKRIRDLEAKLGTNAQIVRAMPNTPAAIGRGISVAVASAAADERQRQRAAALLAAVGMVEWVDDESLIDAVTAVSGSGPAYAFLLVECMAAAGARLGLSDDLAMRLARATVEGSGELMFREPGLAAATLRQNVTSPGGTTAAALEVLMAQDGMGRLFEKALAAAARRAAELAG